LCSAAEISAGWEHCSEGFSGSGNTGGDLRLTVLRSRLRQSFRQMNKNLPLFGETHRYFKFFLKFRYFQFFLQIKFKRRGAFFTNCNRLLSENVFLTKIHYFSATFG
jgi:hypothetical protein